MKKFLLTAALALATVGSAFAQQGQMAAGINLGVVPCLESGMDVTNFQLGAKFQYGFTDAFRAEADVEYGFESKNLSVFDVTVNGHYLIDVASKFKMYPLVGVGYASIKQSVDFGNTSVSSSVSRFVLNVGVGGEYDITDNLAMNLEIKYQYMKDFNRMPILLGIAYKF